MTCSAVNDRVRALEVLNVPQQLLVYFGVHVGHVACYLLFRLVVRVPFAGHMTMCAVDTERPCKTEFHNGQESAGRRSGHELDVLKDGRCGVVLVAFYLL